MHWKPRGWTLVGMLLLAMPGVMAVMSAAAVAQVAQITTTTVTDTIYRADGTTATGTVLISWPAFATAIGQAVPSGSTSATIGAGGVMTVQLVPNAGSTPMGSYYTAVYHLDDGTVSREYWVVPVSQTAVQVSAIRTTVLPTSVAMQTVSKSYVDTAIAAAVSGHPLDSSTPYVLKSGDTMTGPLVLASDPTTAMQAADKEYVDTNVAAVSGGIGQKVSLLPSGTQTVAQPAGTQMDVNLLNGVEYASQFQDGRGGDGIANALAGPDCANGCELKVEQTYNFPENYSTASFKSSATVGTHVEDSRNGERRDSYMNPTNLLQVGQDAGQVIDVASTKSATASFQSTNAGDPASFGLLITHEGLTGGSNLFPAGIESAFPYFKSTYSATNIVGTYNTEGQHVLNSNLINCYGVGDCLMGSQFMQSSGGFRDDADEGAHPFDLQIAEDTRVFQGTCSSGCTTGSTVVTVAATSAAGTQGEGRYLIDKNPAKVISTGVLTGAAMGAPGAIANFSGTAFPVSVFLTTAQMAPSQANNIAPGTVTLSIATSGVTAGFATNTAALPSSSGVACVVDVPNGFAPHNYEMANYTVVDGTHIQLTLNKAHASGATIAVGGLCGYGVEQTVDTTNGIRQVFPVIGSPSATSLYYAGGQTPIVGLIGQSSAFLNLNLQVATIARNNNVVTVTTAGNLPMDVNGLTMTVAGVADSSYNGSYLVTTTGPNTLTYAETGANSTSTGGTVGLLTGGYALYPMAEVLGVFNQTTKKVDGQMTLAANTVPWAANDALEQPHYYQQAVSPDTEYVTQVTPRPLLGTTSGIQYQGNAGPGVTGWTITNGVPASSYLGNGGMHTEPAAAYSAVGVWRRTLDAQAGDESVFSIHCNSHGCGKWNSIYNLFELDSNVGTDAISFQPTTSTLTMTLRGTSYGFSPQGLTAGTVNATTLNGAMNATNITSGTVNVARLPVFGASGSGHAAGVVPDPGAVGGAGRYLREDGTWDVPAGGGGSPTNATALPGTIADYNFLQGTGTVLTDNSGNGNNATLGVSAQTPSWSAAGLTFTGQAGVQLPTALNGAKTIMVAVYINPLTSGVGQIQSRYSTLVSSSIGASGYSLLYSNAAGVSYQYALQNFAAGVSTTTTNMTMSGFHVFAAVLGSGGANVDHLYMDGVEVPYVGTQGVSGTAQTSGNLYLGSSNSGAWASGGMEGTYYRAAFFYNQLTAAQVQAMSGQVAAQAAAQGAPTQPVRALQSVPDLHCIGDSITWGQGVTSPFCSQVSLTNQPAYVIKNWGIPSITLAAIVGSEPNRVGSQCGSATGGSIATVMAGTNDLAMAGSQVSSVMGSLGGEITALKTAGCKVFVGTMISRTGTDPNATLNDTDKDLYDAAILNEAVALGADGVVDYAANPLLGADGAYSNGTYFQGDGIHPTQTGQGLMAAALSNTLNYYTGSRLANPHVVTASTYQMLSSDGAVTAAPTANAAYTMPDCTGPSGATYTISNPQAAFAVTIAGGVGQPINGLSSAITIPSNSTVTLRDVPNPKTTSGCHWVM